MRERNRERAEQHEAYSKWPNGSEVTDADTQRLKGYVVYRGTRAYEVYDAEGAKLGDAKSTGEGLTMLNSPRAMQAASRVHLMKQPKARRKA